MLAASIFILALLFAAAHGYEVPDRELALRQLGHANNYFAVKLHRKLSEVTDGNIFFSPFAVSSVLTMLYNGAQGETAVELREVLGYERLNDSTVFSSFHYYLTEVIERVDPKLFAISCASAMIVDNSFPVLPQYKTEIGAIFQAYIEEANIAEESAAVVDRVNTWAKIKTKGAISDLVDSLDPGTTLFLGSAAYFKGAWKVKFDPKDTKNHPFYNGGRIANPSDVPMMHAYAAFHYFEDDHNEFTAAELFYEGRNISMVIYLPCDPSGLYGLEEHMTASKLMFVRSQMYYTKMHLTMPKFKLEYQKSLRKALKDLGLVRIFTPAADLSGMMSEDAILALNDVKHKALVEVNEKGTVAAAVTRAVMMKSMSQPTPDPEFKVDHPFLFAIFDTRSNMILFMGRITSM